MKRLAILGASGHGKVVADAAEACGWTEIIFFDDAWPSRTFNGFWSVFGMGKDFFRKSTSLMGLWLLSATTLYGSRSSWLWFKRVLLWLRSSIQPLTLVGTPLLAPVLWFSPAQSLMPAQRWE